ncbi:arginine and glutamate-rich protein 1-like [Chenopodium quinoa]|uniref:arginine and glutamate-rich protein 1-like n=1 Tax=Chenopodium quinoa TaxID=63459 RepID=UPI000B770BA6|nr:arginine and glutamate-rich protein 1-like [Chenopodium quinoa]
MARIRVTAIDPDYQSDDPAVDSADPINQEQVEEPAEMGLNEEVPQNSPSVPSTPGDSILDSSGSNAEESGEVSGEGSGEESGGGVGEGSGEISGEGTADNGESEEAKRMVPPEKTPATSAILLRKKQLEEKKAAMAAKNAGAGSQVIPLSVASMQKRPAGIIPKPAAKVPRVEAPAPAAGQKEKTPDKDRPTTAGKSLQFSPHFEMVVESARSDARTLTGSDTTSCRPNYQQYAKRMVKTITRSEREAVSAVHRVNLDRITSLLPETLLSVDGLSVPLRKKQEEVRDAQKRASELIDVCQFNAISYDLETEQRKLQQEELLKKAAAAGEAALKRVDELELQVKNLQTDLKARENADKENVNLLKDNSRLVAELANNQAADKKELEQEQLRLIAENEADCEERMKLAWSLIHPDFEYE